MLDEFENSGFVRVELSTKKALDAFNTAFKDLIVHFCRVEGVDINDNDVFHESFMHLDCKNHARIHEIYNILRNSNVMYDIVNLPEIKTTTQSLLGLGDNEPLYYFFHVCRMDPPGDEKFILRWHQEDYKLESKRCSIRIWAPLVERNGPKNGSMDVLVGSHKAGELPHHINQQDGYSSLYIPEEHIEFSKYQRETVDMEPGQILFLDPNLIHKSNYNGGEKVRYSLAVHVSDPKHENFKLTSKEERSRLSREKAVNYEELKTSVSIAGAY